MCTSTMKKKWDMILCWLNCSRLKTIWTSNDWHYSCLCLLMTCVYCVSVGTLITAGGFWGLRGAIPLRALLYAISPPLSPAPYTQILQPLWQPCKAHRVGLISRMRKVRLKKAQPGRLTTRIWTPNYTFCSHPTRAGCLSEILLPGKEEGSYCCRPELERAASPSPPSLTPNPEEGWARSYKKAE